MFSPNAWLPNNCNTVNCFAYFVHWKCCVLKKDCFGSTLKAYSSGAQESRMQTAACDIFFSDRGFFFFLSMRDFIFSACLKNFFHSLLNLSTNLRLFILSSKIKNIIFLK